ncbi:glutamate-cysteine ligase family protein [Arthrobacter sp. MDB2-24]
MHRTLVLYRIVSEQTVQRFGLTAVEQLTCGCHMHVEIESEEEGVAVPDRIRVWLPPLLAITANSPYWNAADSGFASYRFQAWNRWPTAGPDYVTAPPKYTSTSHIMPSRTRIASMLR